MVVFFLPLRRPSRKNRMTSTTLTPARRYERLLAVFDLAGRSRSGGANLDFEVVA